MIITKGKPFTKEEIRNKNRIALASISMDLMRVSLGYQRGSLKMVDVFLKEALKRKKRNKFKGS